MNTLRARAVVLAIGLSGLAGYVDALGYLELHGTFIAFMSGNSTQLAVGLSNGGLGVAAGLGGIIALFVGGVILGTFAGHVVPRDRHVPVVLSIVTGLLLIGGACAALSWPLAAVAAMTLAMGVENATFQRDGDVVVGLTYMTGALVKIGQNIARALNGGDRWAWLPYLLLWLGLVGGGSIGAYLYRHAGLSTIAVAIVWSATLAAYAWGARISVPQIQTSNRNAER